MKGTAAAEEKEEREKEEEREGERCMYVCGLYVGVCEVLRVVVYSRKNIYVYVCVRTSCTAAAHHHD
jgi:hypothetical protein